MAAKVDARSRIDQLSEFMPYRPASSSPFAPEGVAPRMLVWAETVAPGGYSHRIVARGSRIRFDDPTGDACANLLLYNAQHTEERLNVADTIKIPWQTYLGPGHPLLSGDGRVLATITIDSSGHHDVLCGSSTNLYNAKKYGSGAPEGKSPSGEALFTLAAAKHGLTTRDLPPAISFFQGVKVEAEGDLTFQGSGGPGTFVELLAELPLLVLVANTAHPLDPRDGFNVGPLRIHAWTGVPTGPTDERFSASPEKSRAYLNTIDYAEAQGL
jgi:urea carboxylase-associated protein 2